MTDEYKEAVNKFFNNSFGNTEKEWQELSDDEIDRIYCDVQDNCVKNFPSELYAAWIKAFKEKNA